MPAKKMPEGKTPDTPSTTEVLRETLPHGMASLIGKAIDQSGVNISPVIISDTVKFYEYHEAAIKSSNIDQRREIIRRFIISNNPSDSEETPSVHWTAVIGNKSVIMTTIDVNAALDCVDQDDSYSFFCCSSDTQELAIAEIEAILTTSKAS